MGAGCVDEALATKNVYVCATSLVCLYFILKTGAATKVETRLQISPTVGLEPLLERGA